MTELQTSLLPTIRVLTLAYLKILTHNNTTLCLETVVHNTIPHRAAIICLVLQFFLCFTATLPRIHPASRAGATAGVTSRAQRSGNPDN